MRGIAEIHFVAVNANPSRAQATCDITADRGRQHRHDDEIESGTDLEGRGGNARTSPRRNNGEAEANAKRENNKCNCAADDRASSDGGIVSPSALAVQLLMTNSNRVACRSGNSLG